MRDKIIVITITGIAAFYIIRKLIKAIRNGSCEKKDCCK